MIDAVILVHRLSPPNALALFSKSESIRRTAAAMLSARGARWAKTGYAHGAQNRYDPVENPQGVVRFDNAENVITAMSREREKRN